MVIDRFKENGLSPNDLGLTEAGAPITNITGSEPSNTIQRSREGFLRIAALAAGHLGLKKYEQQITKVAKIAELVSSTNTTKHSRRDFFRISLAAGALASSPALAGCSGHNGDGEYVISDDYVMADDEHKDGAPVLNQYGLRTGRVIINDNPRYLNYGDVDPKTPEELVQYVYKPNTLIHAAIDQSFPINWSKLPTIVRESITFKQLKELGYYNSDKARVAFRDLDSNKKAFVNWMEGTFSDIVEVRRGLFPTYEEFALLLFEAKQDFVIAPKYQPTVELVMRMTGFSRNEAEKMILVAVQRRCRNLAVPLTPEKPQPKPSNTPTAQPGKPTSPSGPEQPTPAPNQPAQPTPKPGEATATPIKPNTPVATPTKAPTQPAQPTPTRPAATPTPIEARTPVATPTAIKPTPTGEIPATPTKAPTQPAQPTPTRPAATPTPIEARTPVATPTAIKDVPPSPTWAPTQPPQPTPVPPGATATPIPASTPRVVPTPIRGN